MLNDQDHRVQVARLNRVAFPRSVMLRPLMASSALVALAVLSGSAASATALPSGGVVRSGQAGIGSVGSSGLVINQTSSKAIIDWASFSVGSGQSVQFNNGSGATLNRVTGATASSIDGKVSATGSLYLINPNGIVIGKDGVVKVGGGFVATTMDVPDQAFLSGGPLTFSGASSGSVVNLGSIGALGGDVVLAAASVRNAGQISAPRGDVGLLAGTSITLRDMALGDGKFVVSLGSSSDTATNSGSIRAAMVELKANGGNVYALAGNTGGLISATGVSSQDGRVLLIAEGGALTARGTIEAKRADGTGGQVETSGASVDFTGVEVNAADWLIDPTDLTINKGAASTINANLIRTNITLKTTATGASGSGAQTPGPGDITINAPISWWSAKTLTLDAYHGINIKAAVTATGPGKVVLTTNDGGSGGDYSFGLSSSGFAGSLSFTGTPNTGQTLAINGQAYTLLYSMADIVRINTFGLSGQYALAKSVDAAGTTYASSVVGNSTMTGMFSGSFVGLGNKVSNLTIQDSAPTLTIFKNGYPGNGSVGLFSTIDSGGVVRDVELTNANTVGGSGMSVGTLAGVDFGAVINVAASGSASVGNGLVSMPGATLAGGLVAGVGVGGTIRNSFASANVTAGNDAYSGGLVGALASGGNISGSYASGSASVGAATDPSNFNDVTAAGGLVGLAFGYDNNLTSLPVAITNSAAVGTVTGLGGSWVGGLVGGIFDGTVTTSRASGAVSQTAANATPNRPDFIGGLIGIVQAGTVSQSYSTGQVTAVGNTSGSPYTFAGAFVGDVDSLASVSNSYSTGNVTAKTSAPNIIVGSFAGGVVGSISNSYSTGTMSGTAFAFGGLVGYLQGAGTVSNSVWDSQTSGTTAAVGYQLGGTISNVQGLSTANLQSVLPATFNGSVWVTSRGLFPYLKGFFPNGAQAISGVATNADGTAAQAGLVSIYSNGNLIGDGAASTGANGYFYQLVPTGSVSATTKLGETLALNGTSVVSGLTYTDQATISAGNVVNFNVAAGLFSETTSRGNTSGLAGDLAKTFGADFVSISSSLSSAREFIRASGPFTINTAMSNAGPIQIQSVGNLTISATGYVTSSASGDAIILAADGSFINKAGPLSVTAPNGRWLIYTQAPGSNGAPSTGDKIGGLPGVIFRQDVYNFSTGVFAQPVGAGNRFVVGY